MKARLLAIGLTWFTGMSAATADPKSYLTFESGGDPIGSQNYSIDVDHASKSGSRYLAGLSYTVLSAGTADYPGGTAWLGYGTDTSKKWSHRFLYEYGKLGDNLDTNKLQYSLNTAGDAWSVRSTLELGRIGVSAGMPATRAEIDRVGFQLDLGYATDGPWQYHLSGAFNNFYGDESVIPTFLFILRYTSAGLFASNFYKQRVGGEVSYNLDHGVLSLGVEQTIVGKNRFNSIYLSSFSELSKKISVLAEAGNTLYSSASSGWYGRMGLTYSY